MPPEDEPYPKPRVKKDLWAGVRCNVKQHEDITVTGTDGLIDFARKGNPFYRAQNKSSMYRPRSSHGDRHQHAVILHTALKPKTRAPRNRPHCKPTVLKHRPVTTVPVQYDQPEGACHSIKKATATPNWHHAAGEPRPPPLVGNDVPGQYRCPEGHVMPGWWPSKEILVIEEDYEEQAG